MKNKVKPIWKVSVTKTFCRLCRLQATSDRISLGPRRGKKVFTLRTVEADKEDGSVRCVQNDGFSLHADVSCEANERKKLERLYRYVARPAIANERLKLTKFHGRDRRAWCHQENSDSPWLVATSTTEISSPLRSTKFFIDS